MKIFKSKKEREDEKAKKRAEEERAKTPKPFDISRAYDALSAQIGDKTYKIRALQAEIDQITQQMHSLKQEFNKSAGVFPELIDSTGRAVQPQLASPLPVAPQAKSPDAEALQ